MPYALDFSYNNINAIDIFLERFQTRLFVGRLENLSNKFHFSYCDVYLKEKNVISLGPEFPLTQKDFYSPTLFKSLKDRIPDPDNPAYASYCKEFSISPLTTDPLILLATIGRRGPSSFIFEPVYAAHFTFKDFDELRKSLELSLQDVALLFDVSLSILQKIKAGDSSGKEVLKRLQLYYLFKDTLMFQIKCNGKFLHSDKIARILQWVHAAE
ncbi:MAG: HipA N-terminal domain-containing protein [Alphaproteobacteria bacterium]|nr:HipA N-terminal domain-containing protein [Alphaproteobacteria bacterium]